MGIGSIMLAKGIVLGVSAVLADKYKSWKNSRTVINMAFDGRSYYDPIERWEDRARLISKIAIFVTPIICIAAVFLLFTGQ